ncbi:hypothetical protein B0H17DRAFT_1185580, partial [Mycena rosella]
MDHQVSPLHGEFASGGNETDATGPTKAFFPNAQHFVVSGGQFTNVTNYLTNSDPADSDLRTIPLGDLDLRHEICLGAASGIVSRRTASSCVRRVYSARVEGRAANMTVAVYAGSTAEAEWQMDLAKYCGLHHPSIVQVYAAARSYGLNATIFHGDLIPIQHFFWLYRHSPISTVYLHGYFGIAFNDVSIYIKSVSTARLRSASYTPWIRRTTGGLCIDLTPSTAEQTLYPYSLSENLSGTPITLLGPDQDSAIISALTLHHYHEICYWSLSRTQDYALRPDMPVHVGGIIVGQDDLDSEIAYLPKCDIMDYGWSQKHSELINEPVIMENGWTRFTCSGDLQIFRTVSVCDAVRCLPCSWLVQANYILSRLRNPSSYNNIVLASSIHYALDIFGDVFSEGYIFMCPLNHLRTGDSSQFRRPECPAYWSLDASGREGVALDGVRVPGAAFKAEIWGWSWDSTVYAGLRKFHHGKGFNPDGPDVALHLGSPLYRFSSPFTDEEPDNRGTVRVDDSKSNDEISDGASLRDGPHRPAVEEFPPTYIAGVEVSHHMATRAPGFLLLMMIVLLAFLLLVVYPNPTHILLVVVPVIFAVRQ